MTARPVFVKLAAFFFAFAAAVALVGALRYSKPARDVLSCGFAPPRRAVAPRARPEFVLAENLESKVELVSLDREAGRSYARLKLRLVGGSLPPERLWVQTVFFNPSHPSGRVLFDDVVEVARPFDGGSTTSVIVSSACSWCGDRDLPDGGYYANVEIYEHGYKERPAPLGAQFVDRTTAVPVVVHADRESSRRR